MRKFILAAIALLISGPAFAQSFTNDERANARLVVADVGVCSQNLYQREGFSGGQKVKVTPVYDRTFTASNGKTVSGAAVANECNVRGGSDWNPPGGF